MSTGTQLQAEPVHFGTLKALQVGGRGVVDGQLVLQLPPMQTWPHVPGWSHLVSTKNSQNALQSPLRHIWSALMVGIVLLQLISRMSCPSVSGPSPDSYAMTNPAPSEKNIITIKIGHSCSFRLLLTFRIRVPILIINHIQSYSGWQLWGTVE